MLLAESLIHRIVDMPWPGWQIRIGGMTVTLMSAGIASMILVALVLMASIIPPSRRRQIVPHGATNLLEVVVVFVRDMIARPALGDKAYDFLPFLLTLFVFVLGMNLFGLLPLEAITNALRLPRVGGVATAIPTVAGALASLSLLSIIFLGLKRQVELCRARRGWPTALCIAASPVLWMKQLAPPVPGAVGAILLWPLVLLELVGIVAKCLALMIRLFANMVSGHTLLAVMMMFILRALEYKLVSVFYVGPPAVLASVAIYILELLVSGLQAYIFTFLTAMFMGLYVESSH